MTSSDYTAVSMTPITFTAGSMDGTEECLNVSVTDDTLVEGIETFMVTLTTGQGIIAGTNVTTVTITDNESIY